VLGRRRLKLMSTSSQYSRKPQQFDQFNSVGCVDF
jgi:hypothetical protein